MWGTFLAAEPLGVLAGGEICLAPNFPRDSAMYAILRCAELCSRFLNTTY